MDKAKLNDLRQQAMKKVYSIIENTLYNSHTKSMRQNIYDVFQFLNDYAITIGLKISYEDIIDIIIEIQRDFIKSYDDEFYEFIIKEKNLLYMDFQSLTLLKKMHKNSPLMFREKLMTLYLREKNSKGLMFLLSEKKIIDSLLKSEIISPLFDVYLIEENYKEKLKVELKTYVKIVLESEYEPHIISMNTKDGIDINLNHIEVYLGHAINSIAKQFIKRMQFINIYCTERFGLNIITIDNLYYQLFEDAMEAGLSSKLASLVDEQFIYIIVDICMEYLFKVFVEMIVPALIYEDTFKSEAETVFAEINSYLISNALL